MFKELVKINERPKPFEFYTAAELWTNEYTLKNEFAIVAIRNSREA